MKKKISCIILALMFAFMVLPAAAIQAASSDGAGGQKRVIDEADILSDDDEALLDDTIQSIIDTYSFDVVILTVSSLEGKTAEAYADDYYDQNGYGMGDTHDGILFLVSMENRDYAISTTGYGITAFTDYGIGIVEEYVIPYLSDEDYYGGFDEFLYMTELYVQAADEGTPFDTGHPYEEPANYLFREIIALAAALLIGLISVLCMRHQMNTARPEAYAGTYVKKGSFKLTKEKDIFVYSKKTKKKKPEESSGGSTTHQSSSGTTHGGSSGKF